MLVTLLISWDKCLGRALCSVLVRTARLVSIFIYQKLIQAQFIHTKGLSQRILQVN